MKLTNSKYLFVINLLLLFSACKKDEITKITNPYNAPVLSTELDLTSNSGENFNSVTISWKIDGISIINGDTIPAINNSITFDNMQPSTFTDIEFALHTPDDNDDGIPDSIYNNAIQIFTRSVYPVTNFVSTIDTIFDFNNYFDFNDKNNNGLCEYTGRVKIDSLGNLVIGDFFSEECEPFYDGNQIFDFTDQDGDGECDFTGSLQYGTFSSQECESFNDGNIGVYDSVDTNQNEICDFTGIVDIYEQGDIIEKGTFSSEECEPFNDGNLGFFDFLDSDGDGLCNYDGIVEIDAEGTMIGLGTFSSEECEPFNDGNIGFFDFLDWNQEIGEICVFDGSWEDGTFSSEECESFNDGNIGVYDSVDPNQNEICDFTGIVDIYEQGDIIEKGTFHSEECEPFNDGNLGFFDFLDTNGDNLCQYTGNVEVDAEGTLIGLGTFSSQECEPFNDGNIGFFDFLDWDQEIGDTCDFQGSWADGTFYSEECESFNDGNIGVYDSVDPNQNEICDFTGIVDIYEEGDRIEKGTFHSEECEPFNDGNLGFFDFLDTNGDNLCQYTGNVEVDAEGTLIGLGTFSSQECEPFNDGNGVWDHYADIDGDGICDYTGNVDVNEEGIIIGIGSFSSDECEPFQDGGNPDQYDHVDLGANGICDYTGSMDDGTFSSDECEPFIDSVDGVQNPWEQWKDSNGVWDLYADLDGDGICDYEGSWEDETFSSDECEPFQDGNGKYDDGEEYDHSINNIQDPWEDWQDANGVWDLYADLDGDSLCQYTGNVLIGDGGEVEINTFDSDECEPFQDGNGVWDHYADDGDGICDYTGSMEDGTFSSQECEPFIDSVVEHYDDWEDFIDNNSNIDQYDFWENFDDTGNDRWDPWDAFEDSNDGILNSWEYYKDINNTTWDPWENYTDIENGIWETGEYFEDLNFNTEWDYDDDDGNGICDYTGSIENGTFSSEECEPFQDGNGQYDEGEIFEHGLENKWEFNDRDGDGICDYTGNVLIGEGGEVEINTFYSEECEPFQDGNGIWDHYADDGDGICDYDGSWEDGTFSSQECEPFQDGNNGVYDFFDLDGDGRCEYEILDNGETVSWENFSSVECEPFTDSNENNYNNSWQEFMDSQWNQVGIHDPWEEWQDSNEGTMKGLCNSWEPWQDSNDVWDHYADDGDGICDYTGNVIISEDGEVEINTFSSEECEPFQDGGNPNQYDYVDLGANGICDYTGSMEDGTFSSDECEPFIDSVDGVQNSWEPWQDSNSVWDHYADLDGDGICDYTGNVLIGEDGEVEINTFSSQECEPFQDGNGKYDDGEEWHDSNEGPMKGVCEPWEDFQDSKNGLLDQWEEFIDSENKYWEPWEKFIDSENKYWEPWEEYEDSQNNIREPWEKFIDSENKYWEPWEKFIDSKNGFWEPWEEFEDSGNFKRESWEEFIDERSLRHNRELSWKPTIESNFERYIIYRETQDRGDLLKNLDGEDGCNCQISPLPENMDSIMTNIYTETDSIFTQTIAIEGVPDTFYYRIRVVTSGGDTRDSYIHYNGFPELNGILLTENSVSIDKDEYIEIKWDSIQASDYFYQYEILRKLGNPNLSNFSTVVIIPNITPYPDINHFWDRGSGFADGTTYYYSVEVVDISGRRTPSDYIEGYSNP